MCNGEIRGEKNPICESVTVRSEGKKNACKFVMVQSVEKITLVNVVVHSKEKKTEHACEFVMMQSKEKRTLVKV